MVGHKIYQGGDILQATPNYMTPQWGGFMMLRDS